MQLKQSYCIATNVCSRKSATTFADLPDWLAGKHKYELPQDLSYEDYVDMVGCYVFDGLQRKCGNSLVLAMEILQSWAKS